MSSAPTIALDTCVLLRLFNVGREDLLGALSMFSWVVVDAVEAEITYPDQQRRLGQLFQAGVVRREALDAEGLALFVELRGTMQDGEATALAWAVRNGASVASDERKSFRIEAVRRLSEHRLLTTPGLFALAIHAGALSINEADVLKADLEANHRFRMHFSSFSEVVNTGGES